MIDVDIEKERSEDGSLGNTKLNMLIATERTIDFYSLLPIFQIAVDKQ